MFARLRTSRLLAITGVAVTALLAVPSSTATASAAGAETTQARAPQTTAAVAPSLAGTIALSNCSGSLVRFPTSTGRDNAMLLTNGHCYEGGMPQPGVVLTDRASSRTGTLLNADGSRAGSVRADRLVYATMTGTDVALYRLRDTYDSIARKTGAQPLTISSTRPADGTPMFIPSSYWKTVYNCSVNGFVYQLREAGWTWSDSIRYNSGCNTIHGTSGSPIVSNATGQVIGINNTGNDNGQQCTLNNPCEVDAAGNVTVTQGQSYGQQTYWFTTCVGPNRTLDLTVAGCLLPKP